MAERGALAFSSGRLQAADEVACKNVIMALQRMVLEIGMGTDIRGAEYTKAAVLVILPQGTGPVSLAESGLEIPKDEGTGSPVIANCCAIVRLDI